MKKQKMTGIAIVTAVVMAALTACGGGAQEDPMAAQSPQEVDPIAFFLSDGEGETEDMLEAAELKWSFLDHPEYDGKVLDDKDALECLYSLMDELGGDEKVELVYHDEVLNAEDTDFYSFEQVIGGLQVYGGSVKLIVDKDGKVLGIASTLVNGLKETPENAWEITAEEATQIVQDQYLEPGEKVYPDLTEKTVLPFLDNSLHYVWVVYSSTVSDESEKAYIANYISGTGEYLHSIPVSNPGNEDALNGSVSVFAFEGYEEDTWTGKVKDVDGQEREIMVPVMLDKETGLQYLGDMQRRIICADYSDFEYNDTLTPVTSKDGSWINNEVITYEMMLRVWNFYNNLGWHGPDGNATPTLILMNYVDDAGQPIDNAFYAGKKQGFQVFAFNDQFGDGSCSDIVGHEFTHCMTSVSRIHDFYANDMGAINEGISDIMGNLIEMIFGDSPDGAWIFSERHSNGAIRNMKDPHAFGQPEYTWDHYYCPNADVPAEENDRGGVHQNDSLLNQISYKLDQAGMKPEEQVYFWMNADLSQTSMTDYPMMAKILPFTLDMCGFSQYKDALDRAISDVRMGEKEFPSEVPEDRAFVSMELPFDQQALNGEVNLEIAGTDGKGGVFTWPVEDTPMLGSTVQPGDHMVLLSISSKDKAFETKRFLLTPEGWKPTDNTMEELKRGDEKTRAQHAVHFDGGKVYEIETKSLADHLFSE